MEQIERPQVDGSASQVGTTGGLRHNGRSALAVGRLPHGRPFYTVTTQGKRDRRRSEAIVDNERPLAHTRPMHGFAASSRAAATLKTLQLLESSKNGSFSTSRSRVPRSGRTTRNTPTR